jgi:type IX secretion system PorP/SprF family membrane protein
MKRFAMFVSGVLICMTGFSQNYKQFNQYIANQGILNPAYNGTRESLSGLIVARNQWIGIDGAPVTQALNVHSPISNTRLGLGASLINENIGAHL